MFEQVMEMLSTVPVSSIVYIADAFNCTPLQVVDTFLCGLVVVQWVMGFLIGFFLCALAGRIGDTIIRYRFHKEKEREGDFQK